MDLSITTSGPGRTLVSGLVSSAQCTSKLEGKPAGPPVPSVVIMDGQSVKTTEGNLFRGQIAAQVKRCLSKGFFVQWLGIDNHAVQIKKNGLQVVRGHCRCTRWGHINLGSKCSSDGGVSIHRIHANTAVLQIHCPCSRKRTDSGFGGVTGIGLSILARPWPVILTGFALVGLGTANVVPTLFGVAGRLKGHRAGASLATVATMGYFGFLAGPPTIGFIASWLGLPKAFALVMGAGIVIATMGVAIVRRIGDRTNEQHSLYDDCLRPDQIRRLHLRL